MSFEYSSNWNQKNELKAFVVFKKLEEENFPRGMQMELCRQMAKKTNLGAENISAKVGNYKSVAVINNPSNASKATNQTYIKYKNYSIKDLEEIIDKL